MQRIKNIEQVLLQVKPLLKKYLEDNSTQFRNSLFTCPNRLDHKNLDETPSAGFIPGTEDSVFNCFSCGKSGDIFTAYSLIEGKEINGRHWYECVQELANRYNIPYELEPLTLEEQEFNNVQNFLQTIVKNAHQYLIKNHPVEVVKYIKERGWEEISEHFTLGYLPNQQNVRKFMAEAFKKYPELSKHLSLNISNPDGFTDQLVGRLIYPIRHRYGYILGLISRKISESDTREKYCKHFIKTYEKSSIIFNLSKAYKTVYLVEGASSVFTLHSKGIKNVVAILGTSFTDQMYNNLVKHGVERIVVCLDGDDPGYSAALKILSLTQNKSDIQVLVKDLHSTYFGKDPDNVIKEFGKDTFVGIPEVSNFKYVLKLFKEQNEGEKQKELKKSLFEIVISNKDAIIRERMLKLFTQETGILKTTLVEEIDKYEKTQGLISDVGTGEILQEEIALNKSIETFEERAWRSNRLLGVDTGFPILSEKIDGLQNGLVLIAGKWNVGKSAFMQSMALNIIKNPLNYVLYFSIDDPVIGTTIPRFLANLSHIPINVISNPLHRIDKNETLDEAEKLALRNKRNQAIDMLKGYSGRLGIKDATDGYDTNFVEKVIKVYKIISEGKQLVVFVDFLNMVVLGGKKNIDRTEQETLLAQFFKHMAGLYGVPVVCTVESTKGVADTTIKEVNIKGSSSLQFRSDLTLLLSSDFEASNKSEMFFYDDKGEAQPIVEVRISKSKFSSFRKSIYYEFHRDCNKFIECTSEKQQEYSRR